MDFQFLNSLLSNLEYPDQKVLKMVEHKDILTPIPKDREGSQGDENVFVKVYQSVKQPDVYIKIEYFTNSYGYGSYVRGVTFVQPKEKVVTIFE